MENEGCGGSGVNIRVHIERLILEGLTVGQNEAAQVQAAVETVLGPQAQRDESPDGCTDESKGDGGAAGDWRAAATGVRVWATHKRRRVRGVQQEANCRDGCWRSDAAPPCCRESRTRRGAGDCTRRAGIARPAARRRYAQLLR